MFIFLFVLLFSPYTTASCVYRDEHQNEVDFTFLGEIKIQTTEDRWYYLNLCGPLSIPSCGSSYACMVSNESSHVLNKGQITVLGSFYTGYVFHGITRAACKNNKDLIIWIRLVCDDGRNFVREGDDECEYFFEITVASKQTFACDSWNPDVPSFVSEVGSGFVVGVSVVSGICYLAVCLLCRRYRRDSAHTTIAGTFANSTQPNYGSVGMEVSREKDKPQPLYY